MFSITTKAQYGVLAVIELASNHGHGLLKIKDIVERKNIPKNYLEQIFNQLQKTGIIRSVRGNKGGYELAEDPSKTSLLQVLEALEGETLLDNFTGAESVEELFLEIIAHMKRTLDVSLEEIVIRQQKREQVLMYDI